MPAQPQSMLRRLAKSKTMKRILFIVGTRPEAIKLAPVFLEARGRGDCEAILCSTGQHREMLDQVLQAFELQADYALDVMMAGQSLPGLTARLFERIPDVLESAKPDAVVVQGDTTTAFAGAMCAFYARVPVAHVEAGLRTCDPYAPFPEEINRRLISHIAFWHFAPTETARQNLLNEGVDTSRIRVTGNTVVDAVQEMARRDPPLPAGLRLSADRPMILVTHHRRESFGEGIDRMLGALVQIARENPSIDIVFPVHPNPNVRMAVAGRLEGVTNVHLLGPLGYPEFVGLMKASRLIITDSGGIQEEAPALGKPVLVTRDVTERPEAVDAGCARLVGTDAERIVAGVRELLADGPAFVEMSRARNPFGDGRASARIMETLLGH